MESYAGFRSKQHDIMVTYLLLYTASFTIYIFFFQISGQDHLSVFDIRARLDVFVFSLLLIIIINLKLNIHALRKSDISLLHKEYYAVSMSLSRNYTADKQQYTAGGPPEIGGPMPYAYGAMPYGHPPRHPPAVAGNHMPPGGVAGQHAHAAAENPSPANMGGPSLRRTGSSTRFQASLVRRQSLSASYPITPPNAVANGGGHGGSYEPYLGANDCGRSSATQGIATGTSDNRFSPSAGSSQTEDAVAGVSVASLSRATSDGSDPGCVCVCTCMCARARVCVDSYMAVQVNTTLSHKRTRSAVGNAYCKGLFRV